MILLSVVFSGYKIIDAFNFEYKDTKYIVLTKLNLPKVETFELLKVEIFKENDFKNSLTLPLNVNGFLKDYLDIKKLRIFFNIEYSENLGKIIKIIKHSCFKT